MTAVEQGFDKCIVDEILTDVQESRRGEYIGKPSVCPFCGEDINIEGVFAHLFGPTETLRFRCFRCHKRWLEVYENVIFDDGDGEIPYLVELIAVRK